MNYKEIDQILEPNSIYMMAVDPSSPPIVLDYGEIDQVAETNGIYMMALDLLSPPIVLATASRVMLSYVAVLLLLLILFLSIRLML